MIKTFKMEHKSLDNETFRNESDVGKNQTDFSTFEPYEEAAATILLLLFTIIICLNGVVIYTLVFTKPKESRLFYFELHLAIADFLVGICSVLGDGITNALHNEWHGGIDRCMVFGAWLLSFVVSSLMFPLGTGVDANPDADDLTNKKGGYFRDALSRGGRENILSFNIVKG
ncbi:cardioacceleratory peptide receptor-like [Ruditapes philippinarum]|uniref:cardioacceleratory peptide receptor-like n=1 Tax=Ruditapes philippinarum TaxID=129788 RepID=UPI00295B194C|nr:cardioacceleratory peptide receptor-like [Ruditapes philippinarum]